MRRTRYLLAYDIRDSGRLRLVHKTAKSYGFAMQYSVFVCDLTMGELCSLRFELDEIIEPTRDSVAIVPLGEGYDASLFEFMGVRPSLPLRGARIV